MIKKILQVLKFKLYFLKNRKCCFSARIMYGEIDKTAAIRQNVRFQRSSIGKYSYIARNSLVQNTEIGSFCSISEGTNIGMPSHPIEFVSSSPVFLSANNVLKKGFSHVDFKESEKTVIGHDVWIGANAQIKGGITIGTGAIIGAGAVVTHDVPPYAIVGGAPARLIRYRFSEDVVDKLIHSEWWKLSDEELSEYAKYFTNADLFLEKYKEIKQ